MNTIWNNFKMFLCLTFVTGVVYPLIVTGIAQLTMNQKANGRLLTFKGEFVGSALIAQKFDSPGYFWGRPSAADYHSLSSKGSNLGPTSAVLRDLVKMRKATILKAQKVVAGSQIPAELLFASGSGLDPHISLDTAKFQIERILKARGWQGEKNETVKNLIDQNVENRKFGFLGPQCVNVLKLNIALDELNEDEDSDELPY